MNERSVLSHLFEEVVRRVAVVQVSSAAAAERTVFSQLTFIRCAVGDHTPRDMMELMTCIRCNNELGMILRLLRVDITVVMMLFVFSKSLDA